MSEWHNAGVYAPHNRTKKAFKEGVKEHPDLVHLYGTSMFDEFSGTAMTLPDGKYSVVGPEPSTKRSWYATLAISTSSTGKRMMSVQ